MRPIAVAAMMRDAGVGAVPLCDADRRPVGIVIDRDIVVGSIAAGSTPEYTPAATSPGPSRSVSTLVFPWVKH